MPPVRAQLRRDCQSFCGGRDWTDCKLSAKNPISDLRSEDSALTRVVGTTALGETMAGEESLESIELRKEMGWLSQHRRPRQL